MLIPCLASAVLEIRSCWQVLDLLTFCCHMESVLGFLVGALILSCLFVVSAIITSLRAQSPHQGFGVERWGNLYLRELRRQRCPGWLCYLDQFSLGFLV